MDILTLIILLGLLEVVFVVAAVAVTLFFKLSAARAEAAGLRRKLGEVAVVTTRVEVPHRVSSEASAPGAEYADFLRQQLDHSNLLLGEAVQPDNLQEVELGPEPTDAATLDRQMLAARHQFLQLELDQQNNPHDDEPAQQRKHLVKGMRALLDAMGWQTVAPSEADAHAPESTAVGGLKSARSEVVRLEEQIASLRRVIDNQHDSMRDLRELLEAQSGDENSGELQAALKKLRNAEAQAVELYRCMEVVESENDRLKSLPKSSGVEGDASKQDSELLRDLVDDQQRTIGSLQELLRSVKSGTDKSSELDAAFDKIQRTNNELNSCIMLLEEENDKLRTTAENLQARFDQQEAAAAAAVAGIGGTVAIAAEDVEPNTALETAAAEENAEVDIDAQLESTQKPVTAEPVELSAEVQPAAAEDAALDIDALIAATPKPATAAPVEPGAEAQPAAAEDDAEFDIDALIAATPKPAIAAPVEPGAEAQPAAAEDDAEFDIDALLEATSKPVVPQSLVADEPVAHAADNSADASSDTAAKPQPPVADDDDIDALLESFGQGAAPPPRAAKPASVEDDTDALLAELFGNKPK